LDYNFELGWHVKDLFGRGMHDEVHVVRLVEKFTDLFTTDHVALSKLVRTHQIWGTVNLPWFQWSLEQLNDLANLGLNKQIVTWVT
jgi:hypothetical protein